jgi:plastocyanin
MVRNGGSLVVLLALAIGCSGPEEGGRPSAGGPPTGTPEYVELESIPDGGTIRGRVTITGPVPKLAPRPVDTDEPHCGKADKPNLSLVLSSGGGVAGVANAVVWLDGVAKGKPFSKTTSLLDQKGCLYEPYLQVLRKGAKLTIRNSDPVNHNVRAYDAGNTSIFNVATPQEGMTVETEVPARGAVKVKCDVHSWMFAWLWVAETPYAEVTAADGSFEMSHVPPGVYQLSVWHELLSGAPVNVTVLPGGTASGDLTVSVAGP